ncbi:MAG: hypothetical protein LAN18_02830 [Acidobacteriia bacterium]|nr:hypothetical protein [Terriglobia bacterium]
MGKIQQNGQSRGTHRQDRSLWFFDRLKLGLPAPWTGTTTPHAEIVEATAPALAPRIEILVF